MTPSKPAEVLLLAPTFTWQAYANLGRDPEIYPGLSHYALHGDGSAVYISTRLKPMPGIGPAARVEVDAVDSFLAADPDDPGGLGTHLLMADLYANYWLEQTGADFGVTTDGALHARGAAALEGCRTLVLSAHPEYWTGAMLDALEQFIDDGGNVIYLGGNGLYWVTSVHPARQHLLEVRRQAGSQTSSAEPGNRTTCSSRSREAPGTTGPGGPTAQCSWASRLRVRDVDPLRADARLLHRRVLLGVRRRGQLHDRGRGAEHGRRRRVRVRSL